MSDQPVTVRSAILGVMADLAKQGIAKERKNQSQGFSFRGIEDVYEALCPLLVQHKLLVIPTVVESRTDWRKTAKGTDMHHVTLRVNYALMTVGSNECITAVVEGEAMDSGDKATSKAMSMAYKYMAFQVFCIPVEGEEDADHVTPPPTKAKPAPTEVLEPFANAEEAIAAIQQATGNDRLKQIGAIIAASRFKGTDLEAVRAAFKTKQEELNP